MGLTGSIETEKWARIDVPSEFQQIVDEITFQKTLLGITPKFSQSQDLVQNVDEDQIKEQIKDQRQHQNQTSKFLIINEQNFLIVPCAIMFLKYIREYLQILLTFPTLAIDLLHRIVEIFQVLFFFSLFQSFF